MTSVSFARVHDTYCFECQGHTGYAALGRDILCSAVSALCYTLGAYIEKLYVEGGVTDYTSDFYPGSVHISFTFTDSADDRSCLEAINAILHGFCLLSESFPDHISADM